MASWAAKRKLTYASIIILVIAGIAIYSFLHFFYKAPTCFDGIQNGNEAGVDCGGSCNRLCQSAFLPPRIEWGGAKLEKLADGLYNAAAYVVNPNINGGAVRVPYKMSLYDEKGLLIVDRFGEMTLYPRRNSIAFQTAIDTAQRVPTKATFEFTAAPVWYKAVDNLEGITVIDKKYKEDENGSSLEVILENKNLLAYENMLVGVVLYDGNGNTVGFSQTRLDILPGRNGREIAPYTWPIGRNGKVTSIEVLPIINPVRVD